MRLHRRHGGVGSTQRAACVREVLGWPHDVEAKHPVLDAKRQERGIYL